MAKTKISEWSTTPSSNTDIDGINIAEGCAPSGINDAIRDLMAQVRSWQSGASGDPFNGPMNGTVGSTTAYAGAFTTLSASSTVTLSGGTANGVAYLNGSKVVTSGSALTFNGSYFTANGLRLSGADTSNTIYQSTGNLFITADAGTLALQANSSNPIAFYLNSSEQMRLTSTGLGIGTSSPAFKLDVSSSAVSGVVANFQATAANTYGTLRLTGNNRGGELDFYNGSTAQAAIVGGTGNLYFYTNGNSTLQATLDSSGNLGLGVTPSAWYTTGGVSKWLEMPNGVSFGDFGGSSTVGNNWYANSAGTDIYKITGYAAQYVQTSGTHVWKIAPSGTAGNAITFSQAMTLDASGNLLVGTTSQFQSSKLSVSGSGNVGDFRTSSASGYPVVCENTASGSTNMVIFLTGASTTTVGSITYNGSLTLYNTTSDQRLKENIQDSDSASNLIDSLKVRKFDWKESNVHQRYGFVAQELVTVAPEAVHQPADTNEMMAVDYSKLVPMLVKEIQSLRKRLADAGI